MSVNSWLYCLGREELQAWRASSARMKQSADFAHHEKAKTSSGHHEAGLVGIGGPHHTPQADPRNAHGTRPG